MSLGLQSEESVREAVDAYLEGRIRPDLEGEAQFETRNSRYRLIDGVLFSASDASLLGAELVGWLKESDRSPSVGAWWSPGARAVLVNRRQGRHIVVTSGTRNLKRDRASGDAISAGSDAPQGGSVTAHVRDLVSPAAAAVAAGVVSRPAPPPLPRRAQIPPCPQLPPQRRPPLGPSSPISMAVPPTSGPVSSRPAAPVHPPPRPIMRSAPSIARPLPPPAAPPPRRATIPEVNPASLPLPRFASSSSATLPAPPPQHEMRARPLPPPPGPLASPHAMVPPPPSPFPYPSRGAYPRNAALR
jgi:hypothetical protein